VRASRCAVLPWTSFGERESEVGRSRAGPASAPRIPIWHGVGLLRLPFAIGAQQLIWKLSTAPYQRCSCSRLVIKRSRRSCSHVRSGIARGLQVHLDVRFPHAASQDPKPDK
jgi:hypothetical protein